MCGIAGVFLKDNSTKTPINTIVSEMTDTLHHRGPDATGIWCDEKDNVAFGHKRLSIIDVSNNGSQPMVSGSGRFTISYNGEVYNYKEIRKEIDSREKYKWRGDSDTEVILAAIECWGLELALSKFVGMFAFSLWDRQMRLLHLVRDRMGIKPLYWMNKNGSFIFGSELKSLMTYENWDAEIDRHSLALFMKYKCMPAPKTVFKDVYMLEPSTIMTIDQDRNIKKNKYWDLLNVAQSGVEQSFRDELLSHDEIIDNVNSAVKSRLVSDVPVGAFLSGGIDSSAVVALMQANSMKPVNTFSVGFSIDSYNESGYAKEIARTLGTNHTDFILEPNDALEIIPDLPKIYDEPFSDSSQIPTYLVSKMTSEHVTVALSGDGGDEVFGGYNRYLYAEKFFDKLSAMPDSLQKVSKGLIHSLPKSVWNKIFSHMPSKFNHSQGGDKLYKLANVLGKENIEVYNNLISNWHFHDNLIEGKFSDIDLSKPEFLPENYSVEYMQLMDQVYYLPNDILTKVDRASMANSLEVRVPLLDHRLVENMWSLPRNYKIQNGVSKLILRNILGIHLSSVNFNRTKTGFSLPVSEWLRDKLKDWAADLLSKETMQKHGLFNYDVIHAKWNEHQSGKNNWHEHLWSVLMFNAWYQHWVEKK